MQQKANDKNIARLMKKKWESDPLSKPVLFEFFGLLDLDFSKPLIESINISLKEEDMIEHIFSQSSEFLDRKSIICFDKISLEILSLFLTVAIVQKHQGNIEDISKYLKNKYDIYTCESIESTLINTKMYNTAKAIFDEIYLNLESSTVINEYGFNYSILNIYYENIATQVILDAYIPSDTLKNLLPSYFYEIEHNIKKEKSILQEVKANYYLHNYFTITLKNKNTDGIKKLLSEMGDNCYLSNFFDFSYKEGSGSLILQKILNDTHEISFEQVRKRTLSTSDRIKNLFGFDKNVFEDVISEVDLLGDVYHNELFTKKAIFSNMLRNNHFMSFLLTCDLTIIHGRFIFWEYLEALTDGKQLQYLIRIFNNQESIAKIETKVAVLESFNIETKYVKSFMFLLKNYKKLTFIEHAVLAKTFDLNLSQINKYKNSFSKEYGRFTSESKFIDFQNHVFNALVFIKIINNKKKIPFYVQ